MTLPTDEVPVTLQDLEQIEVILQACEGLVATHDLQTQFLAGTTRPRPSPLGKSIQSCLDQVSGYIAELSVE